MGSFGFISRCQELCPLKIRGLPYAITSSAGGHREPIRRALPGDAAHHRPDRFPVGIIAKGFFTSQVGHLLGEIKLLPAILFYLLYVAGIVTFVSGRRRHLAIDGALRRAVRTVLLRDFELASMSMLRDLSWAVVVATSPLVRDGGRIDRRAAHGELGGGKILGRHFGCGTIRIYGFGDFQPCG